MGLSVGGSVGPLRASVPLRLMRGVTAATFNPVFVIAWAVAFGVGAVLTGHGFGDGIAVGLVSLFAVVIGLMLAAWALVIAAVVLAPVLLLLWFLGVAAVGMFRGVREGTHTPVTSVDEDQHRREVVLSAASAEEFRERIKRSRS